MMDPSSKTISETELDGLVSSQPPMDAMLNIANLSIDSTIA